MSPTLIKVKLGPGCVKSGLDLWGVILLSSIYDWTHAWVLKTGPAGSNGRGLTTCDLCLQAQAEKRLSGPNSTLTHNWVCVLVRGDNPFSGACSQRSDVIKYDTNKGKGPHSF